MPLEQVRETLVAYHEALRELDANLEPLTELEDAIAPLYLGRVEQLFVATDRAREQYYAALQEMGWPVPGSNE
jgi:hypothetical protein